MELVQAEAKNWIFHTCKFGLQGTEKCEKSTQNT